jgi:hypothetical protein
VPFATQPAVEEVQGSFGLVQWNHVACAIDSHKGEVTAALDLARLLTAIKLQRLTLSLVEVFLTWPFEGLGPGLVTEPVADEVSITGVDQDWDLLENAWDNTVEWLHPVTLEEEVAVDIEVAAVVAADFNTQLLHNGLLIEVRADPAKGGVAEVAAVLALATN